MAQVYLPAVAAIIALYLFFLLVGWLAARRTREGTAGDLLLAGRAMPLWMATLTMTATWVDGGYLLGTAEGALSSIALGIQGGLCFGLSLIVGGLFFAKKMRRLEFTTLVDPFDARYGRGWAAVLMLPALFGELIWSAELLVAIGSTFGVILGLDLATSILLCAVVVTFYTLLGGLWSVAYTDAVQLGLIPLGLVAAMPFALAQVGGIEECFRQYSDLKLEATRMIPPLRGTASYWSVHSIVGWWETSIMLLLGGIPWNCYFQRVLSCAGPTEARWHSIIAGALTILLAIPPLVLGMVAAVYVWPAGQAQSLLSEPSLALPLLLRELVPYGIGLLGLAAIVGAVTSSFSSSILSAGSMLSWNFYRRLVTSDAQVRTMRRMIRLSIGVLGALAAALALRVESVQQLWFFSADLVFVLLFPQLLWALFDRRANRVGSMTAFAVSLVLRLGGGEPVLAIPAFLPYAQLLAAALHDRPADWYDPETGVVLAPYKLFAMLAGLVLLPIVSRMSGRWDRPRKLGKVEE
jgi:high affinity choline transporter 7